MVLESGKWVFQNIKKTSPKIWRGSSDSKIARNLSDFSNYPEIIKPISELKWNSLLPTIKELELSSFLEKTFIISILSLNEIYFNN